MKGASIYLGDVRRKGRRIHPEVLAKTSRALSVPHVELEQSFVQVAQFPATFDHGGVPTFAFAQEQVEHLPRAALRRSQRERRCPLPLRSLGAEAAQRRPPHH